MLKFHSLTLAYSDRPLFNDLDYDVKAGEVVGITGESGCGKTSLLRAIVGVIPIAAGTIEVCGLPLDVHHIHAIRQKIAYVPQELQPPVEKGADLIGLSHRLSHNSVLQHTCSQNELMQALGLETSLFSMPASALSGGQRQRMLLMAALLLPKPLLLLDEPTSALDEETSRKVATVLQQACRRDARAALVVSHDPVFLSFCDHVLDLTNL